MIGAVSIRKSANNNAKSDHQMSYNLLEAVKTLSTQVLSYKLDLEHQNGKPYDPTSLRNLHAMLRYLQNPLNPLPSCFYGENLTTLHEIVVHTCNKFLLDLLDLHYARTIHRIFANCPDLEFTQAFHVALYLYKDRMDDFIIHV